MSNAITDNMKIGAVGELLVQLRLLEYGVQAAPPIKDTGNDLIAVLGEVFRSIQIKTTTHKRHHQRKLPKHYDILALVRLEETDVQLLLDKSDVYLIPRAEIEKARGRIPRNLTPFLISFQLVDDIFTTATANGSTSGGAMRLMRTRG